jgi:hypothetical protein
MINFLPRTKPINETAGGSDHLTEFWTGLRSATKNATTRAVRT